MSPDRSSHRIAVVGGTGPQGKGLAYRFARHGYAVVLGSRSADKARAAAGEVNARLGSVIAPTSSVEQSPPVEQSPSVEQSPPVEPVETTGATNIDACADADVVLLAVPYDGHDELVATLPLDGRTVISCVNPLAFDKAGPHGRLVDGGEGSAAESAQRMAPGATVVGAFHHVSAVTLWGDADYLDQEDVLVCGDSADGKAIAIELARCVTGRPGIDAGRLRLARQLEPLTAVLISINKRYKVHSGIRVAGL